MSTINRKLLLHVCCAPCSGGIIEILLQEEFSPDILFYNPNIYPRDEYLRRKNEISVYAAKNGLMSIDVDHDPDQWVNRVKGLELEPERGRRCQTCFDMRLERTALYAHEHGYDLIATTNGISRWKDISQVSLAGQKAVSKYHYMTFLDRNWRKDGGMSLMSEVTLREGFYRQDYCGCLYSLKASQIRKKNKTL
ncbi:MAG: epoxyqueuosine reductase QueH [Candidatus Omnitrophota bacterium]